MVWSVIMIEIFEKLFRRVKQKIGIPTLRYVETHLVDHCNLNCKGCGHFCPIAPKWFCDLEDHANDMRQLSRLFSNIEKIRLMGGEPLLHPEVNTFLVVTRKYFPRSDIHLVTNGILLPKMSSDFWKSCKENRIVIDITVYPPFLSKAQMWVETAKKHEVKITTSTVENFFAIMNEFGTTNPKAVFENCRNRFYCPFLRKGKIYACAGPALIHHFNERYGMSIPSSEYVDIYKAGLKGQEVLEKLDKPMNTCRYCSEVFINYEWEHSTYAAEDWFASTYDK
jgi:hypothetical protein